MLLTSILSVENNYSDLTTVYMPDSLPLQTCTQKTTMTFDTHSTFFY